MKIMDKPFKLYASCFIVKGVTRSTINDLQRNKYYFIPNSLFSIISKYENYTLEKIYSFFNDEDKIQLDEYFEFLIDKELIFFTDYPESFPKLNLEWNSESQITNSIIDFSEDFEKIDYINIISQLSNLGCKAIQLRSFYYLPIFFLERLLSSLEWNGISEIQLILKYDKSQSNIYSRLYEINPRISMISVHSAPFDKLCKLTDNDMFEVNYSTFIFENSSHCGVISPTFFVNNINFFIESQKFNSCLNRKICIDTDGLIKNCPTLNKNFGHINKVKLIDVINNDEFKSLWTIAKDEIIDCRDCEFRFMCSDCRSDNDGNINLKAKPSKCKYNPHLGVWEI